MDNFIEGLKDNPKGSADDEGADDRLDQVKDAAERDHIKDQAWDSLHAEEERKDRQDYIQDRNEAYSDGKLRRKLDADSQRSHGDEPVNLSE